MYQVMNITTGDVVKSFDTPAELLEWMDEQECFDCYEYYNVD